MKLTVFAVIPSNQRSESRYERSIKAACKKLKLSCSRIEKLISHENALEAIFKQIAHSDIIIVDIAEQNSDIFFKLGYAKAMGKKIILLTDEEATVPPDLREYPHIICSSDLNLFTDNLIKKLKYYTDEIITRNFKAESSANDESWTLGKTGGVITNIYPKTDAEANKDLVNRIELAEEKFTAFGLTRNFYVSDYMYGLIARKALQIPIKLFLMDPDCDSRADRYRLEPMDAGLKNPAKYKQHIAKKYSDLMTKVNESPTKPEHAGLNVYYFNFPCSFAIEESDNVCRIMLYGHNKRGTDSPIFVFNNSNPYYDYFISQLRWIETLAEKPNLQKQLDNRNIIIRPLD